MNILHTVVRYPYPGHFGHDLINPTVNATVKMLSSYSPDAILTVDEDGWLSVLGSALDLSGTDVSIWPIVPNMPRVVREVADNGVIGSQIRRFMKLGVRSQMTLLLRIFNKIPKLARNDFVTGILMLVDMEMTHFKRRKVDSIVLSNQITELALTFQNRRLFTEFIDVVRCRYGASAGFMTSNLRLLVTQLTVWGLEADIILTPFNLNGFGMNPTKSEVEETVRSIKTRIVALDFDVNGTVSQLDGLNYLKRNGINTYAVTPF